MGSDGLPSFLPKMNKFAFVAMHGGDYIRSVTGTFDGETFKIDIMYPDKSVYPRPPGHVIATLKYAVTGNGTGRPRLLGPFDELNLDGTKKEPGAKSRMYHMTTQLDLESMDPSDDGYNSLK